MVTATRAILISVRLRRVCRPAAVAVLLCAAGLLPQQVQGAAETPTKAARAARGLLDEVLELNRVQEPELDLPAARTAFGKLIAELGPPLAAAPTPREKVAVLNKGLLADRQVSYLSNKYWRDSTLAASLLRRKGNCLSTSTLYVLAGEALGLPIKLVVVPGHAFVRWDDGRTRINIETASRGEEIADETYLNHRGEVSPADVAALGWGCSLDRNGFLAELHQAAAWHRHSEGKLDETLALLKEVERLAPQRSDLRLARISLEADATNDRETARKRVWELLNAPKGALPPSVHVGAIMFLAHDAAARRDFQEQRRLLLMAFPQTPKVHEPALLQELAFCHRSLKDYRGGVRYLELALTFTPEGSPEMATALYNLAILQKNDNRLDDALASIRRALQINPESWNSQMLEAGYLVLKGEREEGLRKFAKIERPRGDAEFYENMLAWFYAVSRQREKFYAQFARALELTKSVHTLVWIEQDVDLDVYRGEVEFRTLVEKHRQRLLGEQVKKVPEH